MVTRIITRIKFCQKLCIMNRAEHESWPAGFPRLYFLICNLNTYPINMKQPDSESYWLGLSINDAKTILFWPDWSQNLGLILYFHLQGIALMNSFQKLFFRIYWVSIHVINKEIKAWETHGSRLVLSPIVPHIWYFPFISTT